MNRRCPECGSSEFVRTLRNRWNVLYCLDCGFWRPEKTPIFLGLAIGLFCGALLGYLVLVR